MLLLPRSLSSQSETKLELLHILTLWSVGTQTIGLLNYYFTAIGINRA